MKSFVLACSLLLGLQANAGYNVQKFPGKVTIEVDVEASQNNSPIDVLFVMDDSGSMGTYQQKLSDLTPVFVDALKNLRRDFHAGVITTSVTDYIQKPTGGMLRGSPLFVDNKTPDFGSALAKNLLVGTNGDAVEQPFQTATLALTEPLLSGYNKGFLRDSAALALIFVTDAEDQSPQDVKAMTDLLKARKQSLDKVTTFSWIVPTVTNDQSCQRDDGTTPPTKIEDLSKELQGTTYSLCNITQAAYSDFADKLAKFGAGPLTPSLTEVPLTIAPVVSSIQVKFGTETLVGGDMKMGWVYDSKKNAIVLGDEIDWASQPVGTKLSVTFVPADWQK